MSSFLCFICHSTVNSETNEETREKYREVVGINLCPDSHLCYICCHVLNKLWLFKSICLKRSLEYPVLFSEKGTINLQRNDLEIHTLCSDDQCGQYHNRNFNSETYNFLYNNYCDNFEKYHDFHIENQYVELEDDRNEFDKYFNTDNVIKETTFEPKATQTDLVINVENFSQVDKNDFENEYEESPVEEKDENQNSEEEDAELYENTEECRKNKKQFVNDLDTKQDELKCDTNEVYLNADINNITEYDIDEDYTNITEYNKEQDNFLEEIDNIDDTVQQKHNKQKKAENSFKKIVLSVEEQKSELEKRRKEKKYLEAEFKCSNCALGFLFKDTYQTHMMRHEESNGEYLCPICTLRFAHPRVLRAHVCVHSVRWHCPRCGAGVRARGRRQHEGQCWGSGTASACHLCGAMFQHSDDLRQHIKRVHLSKTSNKSYSCSVCGGSYNNQAAVRAHMFKHINRKFPCDKCDSVLSSPYLLAEHRKKHETTGQHFCTMCDVSFTSKKSLLKHKRVAIAHQHNVLECPICSRGCATQQSLASHIQAIHHSIENYSCPACPARYSTKKSLNRHIRTHSGKKETKVAVCHLCGANFKDNSKLNRHLKTVCEKAKLEEQFTELYEQECMNVG